MNKKISIMLASLGLIVGFGLSLASPVLVSATGDCDVTKGLPGGLKCSQGDQEVTDLFGTDSIFSKVTNTLMFLIGSISVIMIIYGAIRYVLSAGDSKKVEEAKQTILYAIIGLILAILAFAIISFITSTFGVGAE